jgi:NADPH:quinone reductase-like Zn-dependent oxidoreductase
MQAYIVEEPGGDFRKVDLPRPTPGANQVLVKISASGVNQKAGSEQRRFDKT